MARPRQFNPSPEDIADILARRRRGETLPVLAAAYGVSQSKIYRIVRPLRDELGHHRRIDYDVLKELIAAQGDVVDWTAIGRAMGVLGISAYHRAQEWGLLPGKP